MVVYSFMANAPIKTRHQQFALKLLIVVVLLGLIFTVWYLSQKKVPIANNLGQSQQTANASASMTINP